MNKVDKFKFFVYSIKQVLLPQDNFYSKEINKTSLYSSINISKNKSSNVNSSNQDFQLTKTVKEKKENPFENKIKMLNQNQNVMLKPGKKEESKKPEFQKIKPNTKDNSKKEETKKPAATTQNNKIASMISRLEGMGARLPGMMGGKPPMHLNKPKENKDLLSKSVFVPSTNESENTQKPKQQETNKNKQNMNSNSNISKKEDTNYKGKYKLNYLF